MMSEDQMADVMDILRSTNTAISLETYDERRQLKLDKVNMKKFSNKKNLEQELKKDVTKTKRLRSRIKKMRREKIFPLPSSLISNYKKKYGLFKINSIQI